jgi:hypothetical protein
VRTDGAGWLSWMPWQWSRGRSGSWSAGADWTRWPTHLPCALVGELVADYEQRNGFGGLIQISLERTMSTRRVLTTEAGAVLASPGGALGSIADDDVVRCVVGDLRRAVDCGGRVDREDATAGSSRSVHGD